LSGIHLEDSIFKQILINTSLLETLEIRECRKISDHGIKTVATLSNLSSLKISNLTLSHRSLEAISSLKNIKTLQFSKIKGVTQGIFSLLERCFQLEQLDIDSMPTDYLDLEDFKPLYCNTFQNHEHLLYLKVLDKNKTKKTATQQLSEIKSFASIEEMLIEKTCVHCGYEISHWRWECTECSQLLFGTEHIYCENCLFPMVYLRCLHQTTFELLILFLIIH